MKQIILKHVLKNALDFQGKANLKVVRGQVLKEDPGLKSDVPGVLKEIEQAATEISELPLAEIKKRLQGLAPELLQEKKTEIKGGLKPLSNAETGKVVVRIAPSPSGALHIGHAYGASLNYEYAQKYQGKLLLRIEDTNPENIYPAAYDLIEQDARWLTDDHITEVIIQSSRLGRYYDYAEQLVQKEKAYVCTCEPESWRKMKNSGQACPCRSLPHKEQQLRYATMFNGYAEGEAVLRVKTDIQHKNPAMRDFGIMRIVEHVHPKTNKEHRVWPLMVFSVAVDDHEYGVTHVLNGKDHADNAIKEQIIMEYLGWTHPEYQHWGRINFDGFVLSTTETRKAIENGEFKGWDDIRIPFLPALRRRGYQPGAFRRYALEIGLSLNDKTVSREEFWKNIDAFNREIIEPQANRYFFIDEPAEITILGAKPKTVEIELHPDFPERGQRTLAAGKQVYISLNDYKRLSEGYIHRLMDFCNFEVRNEEFHLYSEKYEDYKNAEHKGHIIHWLPASQYVKAEVLNDKGVVIAGLAEPALAELPVGTIVQLERRYFARLDTKGKDKITLWYLHK